MAMTLAVPSLSIKMLKCAGHTSLATVAGLKPEDILIQVLHFTDATGDKFTADITASCAPSATAGKMTCPDTTGDTLLVTWHSVDGTAGPTFATPCFKTFLATGEATDPLTVTGITADDIIIGALHFDDATSSLVDQVPIAQCTPGAGEVDTGAYGSTASGKVWFLWHSSGGAVGHPIQSKCIKSFKAASVAAPATPIIVTGLRPKDTLLSVLHFTDTGAFGGDDVASCTPSATAGNMYSSETYGATNHSLVVLWHDADA